MSANRHILQITSCGARLTDERGEEVRLALPLGIRAVLEFDLRGEFNYDTGKLRTFTAIESGASEFYFAIDDKPENTSSPALLLTKGVTLETDEAGHNIFRVTIANTATSELADCLGKRARMEFFAEIGGLNSIGETVFAYRFKVLMLNRVYDGKGQGNDADIDLSFITASANDILEGKTSVDSEGGRIEGNIPTVSATLSRNTVTVPKGYIEKDQRLSVPVVTATLSGNVFTVPEGYIAQPQTLTVKESTPTLTANTANIPAGYVKQYTALTVPETSVDLEQNVFTVEPGYIRSKQVLTVPETRPILSGNAVTIEPGYIKSKQSLTVEEAEAPSISGNIVTINPGYIASTQTVTVPEAGDLSVSGNVVTVPPGYIKSQRTATVPEAQQPTITDNNVTVYKGYTPAQKTVTVPEAKSPTVSDNKVTVYKGYQAEQETVTVAEMAAPDVSDNTVTINKGYNSEQKTVTIPEAADPSVTVNKVSLPAGYNAEEQTVTIAEAADPTTSGNEVTINKGYIPEQKKVTVGTAKAAKTYTPGTSDQTIAAGTFLTGAQVIKGDSDLTAGNIKSGVSVFNVSGTFTADATASAGDILNNKTAYVNGTKITGTVKNVTATLSDNVVTVPAGYHTIAQTLTVAEADNPTISGNIVTVNKGYIPAQKHITVGTEKGATVYTPSTNNQTIPAGTFLTGDQTIKGDANFTPDNIAEGVTIWGKTGTFKGGTDTSDATAVSGDILEGKTAYVNGTKITGTLQDKPDMPSITVENNIVTVPAGYNSAEQIITVGTAKEAETFTPGTSDITIPADTYLTGEQVIRGDSNLTPENIKTGVSIFDVEGIFTADADAEASDIAAGKIAYVKGEKITGTAMPASGYSMWKSVDSRLHQLYPSQTKIPVPTLERGNIYLVDGVPVYINGSTFSQRPLPTDAAVEYLVSPQYPNAEIAFAIAGGQVYYMTYSENAKIITSNLSSVSELVVANGDRYVCRSGTALYAGHRDKDNSYFEVPDVSAAKLLNYYAGGKVVCITTEGGIAIIDWSYDTPRAAQKEQDKGNGNPFTNVGYLDSNDIYMDYGGAAYMLAFRETGKLWGKDILTSGAQWSECVSAPDLIRTNWLGNCITSVGEEEVLNEETGEYEFVYVVRENTVALHIDTQGHLWKISAQCDDSGNPTGIKFTQIGEDTDWQYVPPSISSGQTASRNHFAQKGGKLIRLTTDSNADMGISWEQYVFSPPGRLIAAYYSDPITACFSLSDKSVDMTRAGGMI